MEAVQQNTTKLRNAIILGRNNLLVQAVEQLITESKNWRVTRILGQFQVPVLTREIERLKPDVIVIIRGDVAFESDLPLQLMESYPDINIIAIGLENNQIEIYNKQKILVKEASDLFVIINQCANQFQTKEGGK